MNQLHASSGWRFQNTSPLQGPLNTLISKMRHLRPADHQNPLLPGTYIYGGALKRVLVEMSLLEMNRERIGVEKRVGSDRKGASEG